MSAAVGPTTAVRDEVEGRGTPGFRWVVVCQLADLEPERGAAALVSGEQIALVRLLDDRVLAVQQLDPFSGAHVVSRGIVGARLVDGEVRPTIASPMYKQVFDLESGDCLDTVGGLALEGLPADLRTWPVRVVDGEVHVGIGHDDDGSAPDLDGAGPDSAGEGAGS